MPAAKAQDRTLGETVDDVTLTARVEAKLVADRANNLFKVDVNAYRGVKATAPREAVPRRRLTRCAVCS